MVIHKVLVVCVGNICRSPMGQALLAQKQPRLTVASAGLSALVDEGADAHAIEVMDEIGIDIRSHRAQQLNSALMQQFDLILCMSKDQERWIKQQWPMHRGKVYRLGHWIDQDISDPYRKPKAVFETIRDLIIDATTSWQDKLD